MIKSPKLFAVLAVLLSFAALLGVSGILSLTAGDGGYLLSLVPYIGGFLAATVVMLLCGGYMKDFSEESEIVYDTEDSANHAVKPKKIPFVIRSLAVSAVLIGANFLYAAVTGSTDVPATEEFLLRCTVGTLIKPAAEEYLFRMLYLRTLISSGIKPYISVIFQAVLFALLHDVSSSPFALFAGVVLGVLALSVKEKDQFKAVYTAHAVYNGILYLILATA